MTKTYTTLKPGDYRIEGDETRHVAVATRRPGIFTERVPTGPGPWSPVAPGMVGKVILPADVIAAEFRREEK